MIFEKLFSFLRLGSWRYLLNVALLVATLGAGTPISAREVETVEKLKASRDLQGTDELHLTDDTTPLADGVVVNLCSEDAWLFFDNMKPNDVLSKYKNQLLINGESLAANENGRVAIWKQGAVVMPHAAGFCPLTAYSEAEFTGTAEQFACNYFYTNQPADSIPLYRVRGLGLDNEISSFVLKRGYMATLATGADGMGYSRCFVADTADLRVDIMPDLLEKTVSFVRVMKWEYVSKKGWVGSYWSSVVNGLRYVNEQCDFTNSTWYYNWSTTTDWTTNPNTTEKTYNQDYVPEKWGPGGECASMYTLDDVSHLLGYNEPDHTEQSNASVETAIAEWPLLQQSGLRLGSPATTDFEWLYSFMTEAKKQNYRVDYVVIHAYWGGLSGLEWYNKMKAVHERTGRPLWIKEWNNGANWTNESWPSGTDAQYEKQLKDLQEILTVMDTASFVERYSIYNWVESKRYIITEAGKLTPAGEYYAANEPDYFFNHDKEVIPTWTVRTAPVLKQEGLNEENMLKLSWTDENVEFIDSFVVERSYDNSTWETVAVTDNEDMELRLSLGEAAESDLACFRVTSYSAFGTPQTSNIIKVNLFENGTTTPYFTQTLVTEDWTASLFLSPYDDTPVVVPGVLTYRNKMPFSFRLTDVQPNSFAYKMHAWDYQESPTVANPDTVAFMALMPGRYDWDGVEAEADFVEGVNTDWTPVKFSTAFGSVPVVFPMQMTDNISSATSVRVRNVTKEGFDIHLQYEGTLRPDSVAEKVSYLAITPGTCLLDGRIIMVGVTPDASVGDNLSGGCTITYDADYSEIPLLFAAMQSEEDTITSVLRVNSRDLTSAVLFKDREKAVAHEVVTAEKAGWMSVGQIVEETDAILATTGNNRRDLYYNSDTQDVRRMSGSLIGHAKVFDLSGRSLLEVSDTSAVRLSGLPRGIYTVLVDGTESLKVVKK